MSAHFLTRKHVFRSGDKVNRAMRLVSQSLVVMLGAATAGNALFAQSHTSPNIGQFGSNEAIAQAAVVLYLSQGYQRNWLEVNAFPTCTEGPIVTEPDHSDNHSDSMIFSDHNSRVDVPGEGDVDHPSRPSPLPIPMPTPSPCGVYGSYDVTFTHSYSVRACPNGRTVVIRSGSGVFVSNQGLSWTYEWEESGACGYPGGPGIPGGPVEPVEPVWPPELGNPELPSHPTLPSLRPESIRRHSIERVD